MTDTRIEHEFIVVDPLLGDVSCATQIDAHLYAKDVRGRVVRLDWLDGTIINRNEDLTP